MLYLATLYLISKYLRLWEIIVVIILKFENLSLDLEFQIIKLTFNYKNDYETFINMKIKLAF
jgi:hypothetical protein